MDKRQSLAKGLDSSSGSLPRSRAGNRRLELRCFWERTGVLDPIYRAVGQRLNDHDIAEKLNLTELNVQSCIAWIVHFLNLKSRQDLVLYASSVA